jgi:mannose-6-phosphate isomerase class I
MNTPQIDSREKLSAQVHPNDETAATFGGEAESLNVPPGTSVLVPATLPSYTLMAMQ